MGGRKDKEAREIALKDTREVSTALSLLMWQLYIQCTYVLRMYIYVCIN